MVEKKERHEGPIKQTEDTTEILGFKMAIPSGKNVLGNYESFGKSEIGLKVAPSSVQGRNNQGHPDDAKLYNRWWQASTDNPRSSSIALCFVVRENDVNQATKPEYRTRLIRK